MAIKPRSDGLAIVFEPYFDCPVAFSHFEQDQFAARLAVSLADGDIDKQVVILEEVRELYWTTDISTTEIRDAYLPGLALCFVPKLAGPVKLNKGCRTCGAEVFVTSHDDLNSMRIATDVNCGRSCPKCRRAWNQAQERQAWNQVQEAWNQEQELNKHPPLPDDPGTRYQNYLQTDHWKERRTSALKRAGFSCQICSAKGELHVHHRTYARRGCELDTDLIVLCAGCHEMFHTNGKLAEGGRAL